VATATTRFPAANSPSSALRAAPGTLAHRSSRLSGALGDDHAVTAVVFGEHRDQAPFVVERHRGQPPVTGQRRPLSRGGRGVPQRDVQGVPAGRPAVFYYRLVAQQPQQQRLVTGRPVRPGRAHEVQAALG
jgi:hypothetical protein